MLVDAHCHLSYDCSATDEQLRSDHVRCVMCSNDKDWQAMKKINVEGIKRSFGIHPWYCHLFKLEHIDKRAHYERVLDWKDEDEFNAMIEVLPDPMHLETYIAQEYDSELVSVIGEIGLDKLFRLPKNTGFYLGGSGPMSRIRVKMSHQIDVFKRFCQLARQYDKPVSIHGVKCHGLLYDICREELMPYNVKICLHSVTASVESIETWIKQYGKSVFFSLSKWINFKDSNEAKKLVKMLPLQCILTETDFPIDKFDDVELADQLRYICDQIDSALDRTVDVYELVYNNFCRFVQ